MQKASVSFYLVEFCSDSFAAAVTKTTTTTKEEHLKLCTWLLPLTENILYLGARFYGFYSKYTSSIF